MAYFTITRSGSCNSRALDRKDSFTYDDNSILALSVSSAFLQTVSVTLTFSIFTLGVASIASMQSGVAFLKRSALSML